MCIQKYIKKDNKEKIGVVFGRFQGLHLGHLEYLLQAKKKCKHMVIGICNSDPGMIKFDAACPHRSDEFANPFSFYERLEMIKGALVEQGMGYSEFTIVPFPINFPERIKYYVPQKATFYLTIYDEWGFKRKKILEDMGYFVSILWTRDQTSRVTSGTEVRERIANGQKWKHLVPGAVYNYIVINELDLRVKKLAENR